jgi:hypothetical protein
LLAQPTSLILGHVSQQEKDGAFEIFASVTLPPEAFLASSPSSCPSSLTMDAPHPSGGAATISGGGGATTIINGFIAEVRVAIPSTVVR